jgi:hypothetical protein
MLEELKTDNYKGKVTAPEAQIGLPTHLELINLKFEKLDLCINNIDLRLKVKRKY